MLFLFILAGAIQGAWAGGSSSKVQDDYVLQPDLSVSFYVFASIISNEVEMRPTRIYVVTYAMHIHWQDLPIVIRGAWMK